MPPKTRGKNQLHIVCSDEVRNVTLGMLDSIVCVLRCFNAVIRFHVPADGDMGFRLETGSVEEQRTAGLIYSHVCSYILLYLLEKEKKKTRKDSSDPSSSRGETFKLPAKEKRSRVVYFDNEPDAQGKHVGTQEQLLEQIMTYLRAFKSSCLDDVPSLEESMKYGDIWMLLNPGLLVPLEDVAEPGEISAAELPMLELKLCCIYKRALAFIGVVKEELCSIAAVVHSALQPEVHLTPEGALCWFTAREDDAVTKAKEFVIRSLSLGGIANLDHALLVLAELGAIGLFFFRLSYAVSFVDWAWRDAKKYATVASEVESALGVICSEQPFGYSGDSTNAD